MVVTAELITALVMAVALAYLFAKNLRRRGRRSGFFWFFLLIFMATWAGGVWLMPFGPVVMGIHWLPFAVAGLIGAVAISLLAGRRRPATSDRPGRDRGGQGAANPSYLSLDAVFWMILLFLLATVILRYVLR
jgi:hypothetical protein